MVSPSDAAVAVLTDPHCNLSFLTFNSGQTRVHSVLSFSSYRFGLIQEKLWFNIDLFLKANSVLVRSEDVVLETWAAFKNLLEERFKCS